MTLAVLCGLFFGAAGRSLGDVFAAPHFFNNPITSIFINEIHYDNTGPDSGEAIEIAGPAGTDLSGWNILLYNGSDGTVYQTVLLSGQITNQQNGYGVLSFPISGIQNEAPDGIALVNASNNVVQFLSYEGIFTATNGAASGMGSTDIGVNENGTEPVGSSLQLSGTGSIYGNFSWVKTTSNSFGSLNTGQTLADLPPSVSNTTPTNGAANVAVDANITITFSEPVSVIGNWFTVICGTSGAHSVTVTPAPPITPAPVFFILDPDVNFATAETCVLVIFKDQVTDTDGSPDKMTMDYSFSFRTVSSTCTPTINASVSAVIINEVAWMGTQAFAGDEWIELYNPGAAPICLSNWRLEAADGTPSISLSGMINPGEFLVLEREDDNVITDVSGQIYKSGLLSDSGETLRLLDPNRKVIDTANKNGGPWPAGTLTTAANHGTMERMSIGPDTDSNWVTNVNLASWNGHDASGGPIHGTPGAPNWGYVVTHTPTPLPTDTPTLTPTKTLTPTSTPSLTPTPASSKDVIISEVAWMGTAASSSDEWIELYNRTGTDINLTNWRLRAADGTPDITIRNCKPVNSNCVIPAGGYFLLERTDDDTVKGVDADMTYSGEMSNSGEALQLRDPAGNLVDTANGDGGMWPAGDSSTFGSMERRGKNVSDSDSAWYTHPNGEDPRCGHDANWNGINPNANLLNGTPKCDNWAFGVTPTPGPTPVPYKSIVISEVAWMGTQANSSHEWIELYNTTRDEINLEGWHLVSFRWSGTQFYKNLDIALKGVISPRTSTLQNDTSGYFLLVANENAVSFPGTSETYDQKYTGSLYNTGEILLLCSTYNIQVAKNCDENHKTLLVDFVNARSRTGTIRPWPAGSSTIYGSMERQDWRSDDVTAYFTHTGANPHFGMDANGNFIKGTPKHSNWAFTVTSTPRPTALPTRTATPKPGSPPVLVLNEVMARAGTDWNADGRVDVYDEFIEVINAGTSNLSLSSYKLSLASAPAAVFSLPSQTLKPGERMVFYGSQSGLQLKDSGDTVRLLRASNNSLVDAVAYPIAKVLDASVCRYADGYGSWIVGCYPTPGLANALTGGRFPLPVGGQPVCHLPDSTPWGFVLAECEETGGSGMWNPAYWDSFPGEGQEVWISDPHNKWLAVYQ
ncbi:MAG: hypothetical protein D8M55_07925 [Chloroflexi bacterium]|nr:hypothetical protein [Chloroflexota bacterium]